MVLRNMKIIFDNPHNIYYGGQIVSGQLLIVTDAPKNLRSIVINLRGEAFVQWAETYSESRNKRTHTRTICFKGQEIYFDNKIIVFGRGSVRETLPPGEHTYPFSMVLPYDLPSSFETEHGYIRYTVKATLDRPWKFNHEAKAVFTVISHLDLNMDPHNRMPIKLENHKTFCCCCCSSGPLTLVSIIPARGFVSGQRVPITIEVDNASNVNIKTVTVELQKYISLHARQPRRTTLNYYVTISTLALEDSVPKNDTKTWNLHFTIPPLPPSDLRGCRVIDLEYKIKVKAKPDGFHTDLINEIPINIGTIPLIEAQPMAAFAPIPLLMSSPSAPSSDTEGASSSSHYSNIPPPSYEECMFGTNSIGNSEDGQYVFGITSYNPRYPTYNLLDPPPSYPGLDWAAPPPADPSPSKKY